MAKLEKVSIPHELRKRNPWIDVACQQAIEAAWQEKKAELRKVPVDLAQASFLPRAFIRVVREEREAITERQKLVTQFLALYAHTGTTDFPQGIKVIEGEKLWIIDHERLKSELPPEVWEQITIRVVDPDKLVAMARSNSELQAKIAPLVMVEPELTVKPPSPLPSLKEPLRKAGVEIKGKGRVPVR
jgi:hypothetical protein